MVLAELILKIIAFLVSMFILPVRNMIFTVYKKDKIKEVYKQPEDGNYAQKSTYKINSEWTFEAFDLTVKGSYFLIP